MVYTRTTILTYFRERRRRLKMGEVADMMLDGTLCEGCGVYLGEDAGYPVRCQSCKEEFNKENNMAKQSARSDTQYVLVRFRGNKKKYCYQNINLDLKPGDDVVVVVRDEFKVVRVVQTEDVSEESRSYATAWIHQKVNKLPQQEGVS